MAHYGRYDRDKKDLFCDGEIENMVLKNVAIPAPEEFVKKKIEGGYFKIDFDKLEKYGKDFIEKLKRAASMLNDEDAKSLRSMAGFFSMVLFFGFFVGIIGMFVENGLMVGGYFLIVLPLSLFLRRYFLKKVKKTYENVTREREDFPEEFKKFSFDEFEEITSKLKGDKDDEDDERELMLDLSPVLTIYDKLLVKQTTENVPVKFEVAGLVDTDTYKDMVRDSFDKRADALIGFSSSQSERQHVLGGSVHKGKFSNHSMVIATAKYNATAIRFPEE